MITPAVHEAALAEASAAAYRDGATAAVAEAERRTAAALERVAQVLEGLTGTLAAVEARLEAEAVEVAVAVARQPAPQLIAPRPVAGNSAPAPRRLPPLVAAPPPGGPRHH